MYTWRHRASKPSEPRGEHLILKPANNFTRIRTVPAISKLRLQNAPEAPLAPHPALIWTYRRSLQIVDSIRHPPGWCSANWSGFIGWLGWPLGHGGSLRLFSESPERIGWSRLFPWPDRLVIPGLGLWPQPGSLPSQGKRFGSIQGQIYRCVTICDQRPIL